MDEFRHVPPPKQLPVGESGASSPAPAPSGVAVASSPRPRANTHPLLRSDLAKRRILIVDDMADSAFILGKLLTKIGQIVRTAQDASTALAMMHQECPDVVLSDIGMPEIDGFEFARRVRADVALRGAVLVALTRYGQDSDRQQTVDAGFDYHLVKPAGLEELQDLLASLPPSAP